VVEILRTSLSDVLRMTTRVNTILGLINFFRILQRQ
jgi:hypothetical protein